MQWDLVKSSLGVCRRDWEARWEHTERSSKENRKTHCKNVGGYRISGSKSLVLGFQVTEPLVPAGEPPIPRFSERV
ncbi:hypothetical protein B296_00001730 [Ensete ventricosum]|uniref:Uncharacterized protein n=1 Tax=Ensete ventricosum TaxID=4639 RepID=A0A427ANE5_ENSVE|nr:hypothetical protein B296_00001730 [Ensete ventricosum]